jgi:hypothetical protein
LECPEFQLNPKILFFVGLILCATGVLSPPVALLLGLVFGLSFTHPYEADSRDLSKFLLQASVVGLGFGMNLQQVLRTGRSGFLYTAGSIAFALAVGLLIGRVFEVKQKSSALISVGTAICGGSAIAAVAPILQADQEETAVSLATIFILNSIALLIFPLIGRALHLSEPQFGLWSALAIHDTSSVVGAAAKYGPIALVVGTTVKLTRALWIIPVALGAATVRGSKNRIQWPFPGELFRRHEQSGKTGADRHAFSDRNRHLTAGIEAGRRPPVAARRLALDHRGGVLALAHPRRNHFPAHLKGPDPKQTRQFEI